MTAERPLDELAALTTRFEVGRRVVAVTRIRDGVWKVAVDGVEVQGTTRSQAEAWEAGVREADRLDKKG
jgi:hypothetical protein